MIRHIGLVSLVILWLLSPCLVRAESGIAVIESDVAVNFPNTVVFTVEAYSNTSIVDVRLRYRVNKVNYAAVVSEGWADFTPASRVEASWVWDMTNAGLPPGAEVTYWWVIRDADGNELESLPGTMHFNDDRYSWQNLTGIIPNGGQLTVFWYRGSESFAQALMEACLNGLAGLAEDIGTYPERPIRVYVYASTDDLRGAMVYSQEWTGGVAFADFSIIAIGIAPSEVDWGKRALVHELAHLVVHEATFSPYTQLPRWLDEGLATFAEGELDPTFQSYLDEAISENKLISVQSLCSPFSVYREKACLAYAESYSIVKYLLENYGQGKMLDLLAALRQGSTYDEALTEVYGFDMDGLDARWRATLGLGTAVGSAARQPQHVLIPLLAALATGLVLWGALALERRGRRGSSGE